MLPPNHAQVADWVCRGTWHAESFSKVPDLDSLADRASLSVCLLSSSSKVSRLATTCYPSAIRPGMLSLSGVRSLDLASGARLLTECTDAVSESLKCVVSLDAECLSASFLDRCTLKRALLLG